MSSIVRYWRTYHGTSVQGRGLFTDDEYGDWTYAGEHKDGRACGLAVATHSNGYKEYGDYGSDGQYDGRNVDRNADGDTFFYLWERGEQRDSAAVYADGRCTYNGVNCEPDDPRFLALTAQVAPVEVRPAAPVPIRQSPRH